MVKAGQPARYCGLSMPQLTILLWFNQAKRKANEMRPNLEAFTTLVKRIYDGEHTQSYEPNHIIPPKVNLNGDTKDTLLTDLMNAKLAIDAADEAMAKATPHGRNYQTMDGGGVYHCRIAREAWRERRLVLQALADELYGLAEHVSNQS
jgi:hypothetical protein